MSESDALEMKLGLLTPNDTITTARWDRSGGGLNTYPANTPEWRAWEAGFAAGRLQGHSRTI